MARLISLFLMILATPLAALDLRPADRERFQQFEAHFGMAIRHALAGGSETDVAALTEALRGVPLSDADPSGDWRCRWMKLGAASALVVYSDFACRIEPDEGHWRVVKLTGSQRFQGKLMREGDRLIYSGVAFVGDTPAIDYAGLPPDDQTPVEPNQTVAQVGLFQQVSGSRARLLLPAPILESDFDVIAFTR